MKKLLIGMLLLIPVIVILIVSATASIVQGAHIAVESVVIYKPDKESGGIVEVDGPILAYISDVGIQLEAIVYPVHASNKSIVWSVENENIILGAKALTVDQNGYVSYFGLGSADIVATAEGNIKARCRIIVTSSDVMGISILNNIPEDFSVGDRLVMEATLFPADAETAQRYLNWTVEGDAVSVDKNGILTAVKSGQAKVRATLKNPPAKLALNKRYAEITVNVLNAPDSQALTTESLIFTGGNSYNLDNLINPVYTLKNIVTFEADEGTISETHFLTVDFDEGENEKTVTVRARASGVLVGTTSLTFKKINFKNSDLWAKLEGGKKVYLTLSSAGIFAELETSLPNVAVSSSDTSVAALVDGYLVAKSVGETTLLATNGTITEEITVAVLPPIYAVNMVFDKADDEMGVEMTRVFGKKTYENGTLLSSLNFEIDSIYTVQNGENKILTALSDIQNYMYLLDFKLDSSAIARGFSLSNSGSLTMGEGDKATVKAAAKYPLYQSIEISASYDLKFIENGVNIGIVSKAQKEQWISENKTQREQEDLVNVVSLAGFDYVNNLTKTQYDSTGLNNGYSIVLHSGIVMNKVDKKLYCSLFGNGKTLRQTREDAPDSVAFYGAKDFATLKIVVDNITVKNVVVRAAKKLAEGQSLYDYRFAGNGIIVDGREKYFPNGVANAEKLKNITISYVIAENAYYCVFVSAADVNLTGAIIRNSGAQSLYINTSVQDIGTGQSKKLMNSVVNMKNCVFSNAINMSIGIITEDLDPSYDEDETVMVDGVSVTRPKYVSYFENVTQSVLNIEGFCDIYNWKTAKELDFSFVSEYGIDGDFVGSFIRSLLEDEGSWETITSMLKGIDIGAFMCRDSSGEANFQLAIGNVGVHYPQSGYIPEESKINAGLTGVVSMDISGFGSLAPGSQIKYPVDFYCYDVANPKVGPDDTFSADKELFLLMKA